MLTKEQDQRIAANILQSVDVWAIARKCVDVGFGISLGYKVVETIVNLNSLLPDWACAKDRLATLKFLAVEFGWNATIQDEFYYDSSAAWGDKCGLEPYDGVSADSVVDVGRLASINILVAIAFDPNKFSVANGTNSDLALLLAKQLVCRKTVASIPAEYLVPGSPGNITTQLVWADSHSGGDARTNPETQKTVTTAASYYGKIKLLGYVPDEIPPDTGILFGIPLRSHLLRQPASQLA